MIGSAPSGWWGFFPELVTILERHGELVLTDAVREQVGQLSAATIDRVLQPVRPRGRRHPLTQTVATRTLKAQIPVRTFGDWHEVRPGARPGGLGRALRGHARGSI